MANDVVKIVEALDKDELPDIKVDKGNDKNGLIGVRYNKPKSRGIKAIGYKSRMVPGLSDRRQQNNKTDSASRTKGNRLKKRER